MKCKPHRGIENKELKSLIKQHKQDDKSYLTVVSFSFNFDYIVCDPW